MHGVVTEPGSGAVRAPSGRAHDRPQRALATALHHTVGRFKQDAEVGLQDFGALPGEPPQTVAGRIDLLAVVANPGDVDCRTKCTRRDLVRYPQGDRYPRLHV